MAAAGSAASSTDAAAAPAAGAGLQLALPHDPAAPAGSGGQPLVLPVVLLQQPTGEQLGIMSFKHLAPLPNLQQHGSSAGGPHFAQALLGAGPDSPGLPTGERRAAPKSSGGGSSRQQQQSGGGSWSIAAAWAPVQHPLAHAPQQQLWTPAAAVHPAGPGSSFDDVLAALRAEGAFQGQLFPGDEEAADALATRRCQRPHASPASQRRRQALPAPGSSARGGRLGGSSIKAQRTPGAQQQQQWLEREPLPTFDPLEVERRLKEKLDQVGGEGSSRVMGQQLFYPCLTLQALHWPA